MQVFSAGMRIARPRMVVTAALQRRHLNITTQLTPNPNSKMFFPGQDVVGESGATCSFHDVDMAYPSPLAKKLFTVPGVVSVFLGPNYLSITKDGERQWDDMNDTIFSELTDFYTHGPKDSQGQLIFVEDHEGLEVAGADTEILDDDSDVVAEIKDLIQRKIRPVVQEDGGDIRFKGFDPLTGLVQVQFHGACVGCPSSTETLKGGIEGMLKHYIDDVVAVEEVAIDVDERKLTWKTLD